MSIEVPLPTPVQIASILRFLPVFMQAAQDHIEWHSKPGVVPYSSLGEAAAEFRHALGVEGFVLQFDWPEWQSAGIRYVEQPDLIASAGLRTLCQLVTTLVREERFCEGHFASQLASGQFAAILQRLVTLHKESERGS